MARAYQDELNPKKPRKPVPDKREALVEAVLLWNHYRRLAIGFKRERSAASIQCAEIVAGLGEPRCFQAYPDNPASWCAWCAESNRLHLLYRAAINKRRGAVRRMTAAADRVVGHKRTRRPKPAPKQLPAATIPLRSQAENPLPERLRPTPEDFEPYFDKY